MADDKNKEETTAIALAHRDEHASAGAMFEVLLALQEVGKAELAKGPGIASNAWRKLIDVIGETFGDDALGHAVPVVGRAAAFMPRQRWASAS